MPLQWNYMPYGMEIDFCGRGHGLIGFMTTSLIGIFIIDYTF